MVSSWIRDKNLVKVILFLLFTDMLKLNSPGIMVSAILVLYIGVGRFRILGGGGGWGGRRGCNV